MIDVIFKRCKKEKDTLPQRFDNVIWLVGVQQKRSKLRCHDLQIAYSEIRCKNVKNTSWF